jgi:hypothetical protein
VLTATGTNLKWYTTATGGTGSTIAPTPVTTTAGNTAYYVSQSNNCGEGPRAVINVTVTPTPSAPSGLNVTNITTSSATLNWSIIAGNFYTVDYKPVTAAGWINAVTATANGSVTINNLSSATDYQWRVSVNCSATPATNYSNGQFTTVSHNNQINNLKEGYGLKISPNPVSGQAIIDYIIADNGNVSIEIINPMGQRVATLLKTSQIRGQYQLLITSEMSKLAKGVYYLQLKQNGRGNVIKFVKY